MKHLIYFLILLFQIYCSSYEKKTMAARETTNSTNTKQSGGEFRTQDNKNQPRIVTYSASLNMEIEKHKMAETIENLTKLIQKMPKNFRSTLLKTVHSVLVMPNL